MNSPRTIRWRVILAVLSVAGNILLASAILHRRAAAPAQESAPTPALNATNHVASRPFNRTRQLTELVFATNATATPFRWAGLEASDCRQYAANLRAAGVPEPFVRDIIIAAITKTFAGRAAEIRGQQPDPKYWQRYQPPQFTPEQKRQLKALDDERSGLLKGVLGHEISAQSVIDLIYMQIRSDNAPGYLPAEKRDAVRAALDRADRAVAPGDIDDRNSSQWQRKREELRVAELSKILSTEELDEYRMRNSATATSVRNELRGFEITPEEFRAIVQAREKLDADRGARASYQKRLEEELTATLGPVRAAEYARGTDLAWVNAQQIAEREGLPADTADRVYAFKKEADAALEKIRANRSLSSDERRQQAEGVKQAAEKNVRAALGESGFKRYQWRGGNWIGNIR